MTLLLSSIDLKQFWKKVSLLEPREDVPRPTTVVLPSFFSFLFFSHSLQELYSCASHGRPILHDTLLKFSFQRVTDRAVVGGGDRGDGRHRTRFPFGDSDDETEDSQSDSGSSSSGSSGNKDY